MKLPKGWKSANQDDINMSGYQGEFNMLYKSVVEKFGEPHSKGDEYKVDAEWMFKTPAGIITIYNYKNGPNYNNGKGSIEDITNWHIGGFNKKILTEFKKATGLSIKEN